MKAKRLVVLLTALTMLFGASVYAESQWGDYEGYPKVKVRMDGTEFKVSDNEVPAIMMKERTLLPLRQVAESLRAIVNWDSATKTVDVYRPNVHMMFALGVSYEDFTIKKPFAKVEKGQTVDFVVFTDADNVTFPVEGFRISVVAPNGETVLKTDISEVPKGKSSFWHFLPVKVSFNQKGDYKVRFAFLHKGEYSVVSEKTITSE